MTTSAPDHGWRVAQLLVSGLGFLALIAGVIFYAGKMESRLTAIEGAFVRHSDIECHGQVCVRLSVIETQVGTMAQSIHDLVQNMNKSRGEHKTPKP